MNKKEFMNYIKAEFPEVINTHWNWCLLENIINYAASMYKGKELIEFLMNIIPEVTYEEYLNFIDYKSEN